MKAKHGEATALVVEATRGALVESTHQVAVAVVDAKGHLVAHNGAADRPTVLRSAAKPFQALPLLEDGAAERYSLTSRELAIVCASHNGEPEQVDVVRGLLSRIGCTEQDLVCGPHRSLADELGLPDDTAAPKKASSVPRTSITSNCSGKHTGMLALARHHDWPTLDYQRADHPVQARVRRALSEWTDTPGAKIGEAVDGCGVMCFQIPLKALALGFARLATGKGPAERILSAMREHPDLIAGRGRLCTALMQTVPGTLAKVGAEGVYGAALVDRGLGIGIKVLDGNTHAAGVALLAVLDQLGVKPAPSAQLPHFATWSIRNTRGETVGALKAAGRLSLD